MIETAKNWLEENYENLIQDLTRLIACKSVEGEAKEGMPFGEECYKALECAGEICQKFGFKFHNCEGYVGYMDYEERGEMPEYGILVHVDVVPPCNFTEDPYTLVRKDGKLIARGAIDDKGPCVIMIYVLAALKQAGFKPKSNIRLMFGANEETGWRDIEYAKSLGLIPKRGYSPDADYP
ncbi:MAG: M20/M25/M40 family metallo-hydrolase, partial [Clostridia bacterium]|nr:M20/M25/M40 family metallo-hydrolase [Clostridia bacterium]